MVKQFIFVPWWIADVLQRRGIPFADITNFKVLRQALSQSDLIQLWELQYSIPNVLYQQDHTSSDVDLLKHWEESVRGDVDAQGVLENFRHTSSALLGVGVSDGLVRISEASEDTDPNNQKDPFILYDIPPAFAVLVINEGFSINDPNLRVRAVEEMVKLSYVHAPFSELASRSRWYACYLNLLATRPSA